MPPKLRQARLFLGRLTPDQIHDPKGTLHELKGVHKRPGQGDVPISFTLVIEWTEAQGEWKCLVFINGDPVDASFYAGENGMAQQVLSFTTAIRGRGTLEAVIELEGDPVYRIEVPVVED
jgi:hypothetical protein